MRVAKWGKSFAIRLPASIVEALDFETGDAVEVRVESKRTSAIANKLDHEQLLKRLRAFCRWLPADFIFE